MPRNPPFRTPGPSSAAARESSFDATARKDEAPEAMPGTPACTFCEGTHTEIMSAFGAHASVATYWCLDCRSPFDFMKWL